LTGPVKWLFGAIFGALYAPFVITGLHHMTNAIDTQLIADAGGTALWPMIALSNIAQGSAVFAYYFMHRHDEREAQISLPATISAYLGVTEPALFGVNVKYIYPFVAGMIGSALAGMLSVTFNVTAAFFCYRRFIRYPLYSTSIHAAVCRNHASCYCCTNALDFLLPQGRPLYKDRG